MLNTRDVDDVKCVEWAKAKDSVLRERSSSGAVFSLLAKNALIRGGIVCGAAFGNDCRSVRHICIDDITDIDVIRRSKYVQSYIGEDVYKSLAVALKNGQDALFSGTACQCAAIKNYLELIEAPGEHLILVDVVCHGVPSPRLWAEWLDYISEDENSKIDRVNFRSKSSGWAAYSVAYYSETQLVRSNLNGKDWYMKAFLNNASLRQSCLVCQTKRACGSDITLGDYWGIQNAHAGVADELGVSAVICNTEKGVGAISAISEQVVSGPSSIRNVIPGNPSLIQGVKKYPKREEFLSDVASGKTICDLMDKWTFDRSLRQKICDKLSWMKRHMTETS